MDRIIVGNRVRTKYGNGVVIEINRCVSTSYKVRLYKDNKIKWFYKSELSIYNGTEGLHKDCIKWLKENKLGALAPL